MTVTARPCRPRRVSFIVAARLWPSPCARTSSACAAAQCEGGTATKASTCRSSTGLSCSRSGSSLPRTEIGATDGAGSASSAICSRSCAWQWEWELLNLRRP